MSDQQKSAFGSSAQGYAGDLTCRECWDLLSREAHAQLIDVRTVPEWNFVGVPSLAQLARQPLFCEWQSYPAGTNPDFVPQLAEALKRIGYQPGAPLLFLCRSGARSRAAAIAMTEAGYGPCYNIADGFEGGLDAARHRGSSGGWKAAGLPWVQS